MGWENSDRARRLPGDWAQRRDFVRARAGGVCEALLRDGSRCDAIGSECDHIEPGDNHSCSNLQWLCSWHHKRKTRVEAAARLAVLRAKLEPVPRPHPGLIAAPAPGRGGGDPVPSPARLP